MKEIHILINLLFWIFLSLTLIGMVKPWYVLWFLDFKNRKAVLKYYGVIAVLLFIAQWLIKEMWGR